MRAPDKLWRFIYIGQCRTLFLVIVALLLLAPLSFAGEFNLIKIGPDYEPESYEQIELPGRAMKAGIFSYIPKFSDNGKPEYTLKAGVLVNGATIYYVDSEINTKTLPKKSEYSGGFDPGGDTNFSLYGDFLLMDSWAYGTGHNRRMYLFRLYENKVELLDVIVNASIKRGVYMDFVSVLSGNRNNGVGWTSINDFDNNGNPEIEVEILRGHQTDNDFLDKIFVLYFEIKNKRLAVNLNPALYRPLFEKTVYIYKPQKKPDAYYIYGFLAGALTLREIKDTLASDQNQYMSVVPLVTDKDKWSDAFHEYNGEKPVLIKHDLQVR